jgi:radical SAM superfamily enzyme YgiQ (UPF0313 family)
MAQVLLIYPSCFYAHDWGSINYLKPHLFSLFSFLKSQGIDVEVLDLEIEIGRPSNEKELEKFHKKAWDLISNYDFQIAAISCWSSLNYISSVVIANICRELKPKSTIVVGGYHPSALPSDFIYPESPFDFIIQGEGEIALLNICKGINNNLYKSKVITGQPLDLKNAPYLEWTNYEYRSPYPTSAIYLSRGCPYSCSFCMEPCKRTTPTWRSYPVKRAIYEIKEVINTYNPRIIFITDACFGFDKYWRREFLRSLIKLKIDNLFWTECRIDLLEKEDIELFSRLNFNIEFGLESCSEKMLKIMRKTNNPREYLNRVREIANLLNEKEISYTFYLIFNHPGETYQTYLETIAFLKEILDSAKKFSGYLQAQSYAFFPGSHIHSYLSKYEQKFGTVIKHPYWWKAKESHARLARDTIPSKELWVEVKGDLNYWYPEFLKLQQQFIDKISPKAKAFLYSYSKYLNENIYTPE